MNKSQAFSLKVRILSPKTEQARTFKRAPQGLRSRRWPVTQITTHNLFYGMQSASMKMVAIP
jgi:hypothetical protein